MENTFILKDSHSSCIRINEMLVSLELPDILIMSEVLAAMMSSGLSVSSAAGGRGTESVCWLTFGRDRRGAETVAGSGAELT